MSLAAGNPFQEAASHDESTEGGAGDGGAEGGGISPGDRPPRHCHALPHLSHTQVGKTGRAAYRFINIGHICGFERELLIREVTRNQNDIHQLG